jgi:hypothetical protein
MFTGWIEFSGTHAECMNRAAAAVKAAGLTTNNEVVGQSTYGEKTDYTAVIRCIEGKNLVFFVVAGPASQSCVEIGQALVAEFRRR